jgi:serine protease Do
VGIQDVTPAIAKAFQRKEAMGVLVSDVQSNTPASRAGLEKGDIILNVDSKPITDGNQLRNTISSMAPDAHVTLKVWRNGAEKDVPVTLGEQTGEEAKVERGNRGGSRSDSSDEALAGVTVEDLNGGQSGRRFNQNNGPSSGVVVTNVRPNSAAAEAGLQAGDVIQEVNRHAVRNVAEFRQALRGSNEETLLLVNRNGRTAYVAIS